MVKNTPPTGGEKPQKDPDPNKVKKAAGKGLRPPGTAVKPGDNPQTEPAAKKKRAPRRKAEPGAKATPAAKPRSRKKKDEGVDLAEMEYIVKPFPDGPSGASELLQTTSYGLADMLKKYGGGDAAGVGLSILKLAAALQGVQVLKNAKKLGLTNVHHGGKLDAAVYARKVLDIEFGGGVMDLTETKAEMFYAYDMVSKAVVCALGPDPELATKGGDFFTDKEMCAALLQKRQYAMLHVFFEFSDSTLEDTKGDCFIDKLTIILQVRELKKVEQGKEDWGGGRHLIVHLPWSKFLCLT